jgi:hypothetical protein
MKNLKLLALLPVIVLVGCAKTTHPETKDHYWQEVEPAHHHHAQEERAERMEREIYRDK